MSGKDYKDLIVWQESMELVENIYRLSQLFPKEEIYGLTSQLRRAAVSISSNIAEGQGRRSNGDFLRYLGIAYGSLCEVETQLLIAQRLEYIDEVNSNEVIEQISKVGRLINGLMRSLRTK